MTTKQQVGFQVFFFLLISGCLVAALVLDRCAVVPLLAVLTWLIRRWLPDCPTGSQELGSP